MRGTSWIEPLGENIQGAAYNFQLLDCDRGAAYVHGAGGGRALICAAFRAENGALT